MGIGYVDGIGLHLTMSSRLRIYNAIIAMIAVSCSVTLVGHSPLAQDRCLVGSPFEGKRTQGSHL
jgi:hypothetical protein